MKDLKYFEFKNEFEFEENEIKEFQIPFFNENSEDDMKKRIKKNYKYIISKNFEYNKKSRNKNNKNNNYRNHHSYHNYHNKYKNIEIQYNKDIAYRKFKLIKKGELIKINCQQLIDCKYSKEIKTMLDSIINANRKKIIFYEYFYSSNTDNEYYIYKIQHNTFPEWSKHWFRKKNNYTIFNDKKFNGFHDNRKNLIKLLLKAKNGYPLTKRQQNAFDLLYLGFLEIKKNEEYIFKNYNT